MNKKRKVISNKFLGGATRDHLKGMWTLPDGREFKTKAQVLEALTPRKEIAKAMAIGKVVGVRLTDEQLGAGVDPQEVPNEKDV